MTNEMTTEIALHCMKSAICEEVCEECPMYGEVGTDHCEDDAHRLAIQALEEIQQYRAIGTVEECKTNKVLADKGYKFFMDDIELLKEYRAIGTIEEFKALKEKNEQIPIIHGKAELELHDKGIRNKAIDEFAERLKDRIVGMQMAELQGEDVCPCHETGEECKYMNQDIACQYCAREQTKKDINEIAEEMRGTT